jgi:hypothetical protein
VLANFVLNPDGEGIESFHMMALLDEHVFTLTKEVIVASIECGVMAISVERTASSAFSNHAGPLGASCACAFLAFGSVGCTDWVGDGILGSVAAALGGLDALVTVKESAFWAEASVDALCADTLGLKSNRGTGTSTGLATFHVSHTVAASWCRAEFLGSPVHNDALENASPRIVLGCFTLDGHAS